MCIEAMNRGACPYGLRREARAPRRFFAATRQAQATHESTRRASGRQSAVAADALPAHSKVTEVRPFALARGRNPRVTAKGRPGAAPGPGTRSAPSLTFDQFMEIEVLRSNRRPPFTVAPGVRGMTLEGG